MRLPRRLQIVVPGAAIGVAMALACGAAVVANPAAWQQPNRPSPFTALLVVFGPCAGPLAEPLAFENYSLPNMYAWVGVLLPLIALHAIWPHRNSAVVTGLALGLWFLLGFSYTYNSV